MNKHTFYWSESVDSCCAADRGVWAIHGATTVRRPLLFVVFAILVMLVFASVSEALWLSDTPLPIGTSSPVSVESSDQQLPAVAHNSATDEYLVVWQDTRPRTSHSLYVQRVAGSGELLASEVVISTAAAADSSPSVVWNATEDEYLVFWTDAASGLDILGQRVASDGQLIGDRLVIMIADGDQIGPIAAWNATANEYLVLWSDFRTSGAEHTSDIYGRRLDVDGLAIDSEFAIVQAEGSQSPASLSWDATKLEYQSAWQDSRVAWPDGYGRRLTSSGLGAGPSLGCPLALSVHTVRPACL